MIRQKKHIFANFSEKRAEKEISDKADRAVRIGTEGYGAGGDNPTGGGAVQTKSDSSGRCRTCLSTERAANRCLPKMHCRKAYTWGAAMECRTSRTGRTCRTCPPENRRALSVSEQVPPQKNTWAADAAPVCPLNAHKPYTARPERQLSDSGGC